MAASRVKDELARAGLTQTEVARRIGCSNALVSMVISGNLINPFMQRAIAELLHADETALWGDLYWYPRYRLSQRKRQESFRR